MVSVAQIFEKAVEALDHLFFVGLQEEFNVSAVALVRAMNVSVQIDIKKEREQGNAVNNKLAQEKAAIRSNAPLMSRLRAVNQFDLRLYALGLSQLFA